MAEDVFGIVGATEDQTFRVEEAVAEGGFSIIYRAEHLLFGAPVALKCLKVPESLSAEDRAIFYRRFREEAQLLFQLSASLPEVVRPLHVGKLSLENKFVPYIVLEWLEGEPLDGMLARRREAGQTPLSVIKLVKLLTPIARALSRAHRFTSKRGTVSVIHRDIKPENIFVCDRSGEQTVKLLDFGIATVMRLAGEEVQPHHPGDMFYAFTPGYGAPEQWAPARFGATSPATDVWGLAITMVESLIGRRPIDGTVDEMKAIALDPAQRPTPRTLGASIPEVVERVFASALALDPRDRTASIDEFWSALERAVHVTPSLRCDARRDASTLSFPGLPPLGTGWQAPASSAPPAALRSLGPAAIDSPVPSAPRRSSLPGSAIATPIGLRSDLRSTKPPSTPITAAEIPSLRVPRVPRLPRTVRLDPRVEVDDPPTPTPRPARRISQGPTHRPALELDLSALAQPRPSSRPGLQSQPPEAARRSSRPPSVRPRPVTPAPTPWVGRPRPEARESAPRPTLRLPATLIVIAALVCSADLVLRWAVGVGPMLGPVRLAHAAVLLLLVGTALFFWRVFGGSRDDVDDAALVNRP
jgi:eukaryotic-like serine/threonine-protein kinase